METGSPHVRPVMAERPAERVEPADETEPEPPEAGDAARRKRRVAEVFGEVLPETTRDERGRPSAGAEDEHYLREVPPHHG